MNICEHLTVTAGIVPNRIAISFEGGEHTYAQLEQLSAAAAGQLLAEGVVPGDRVALILPNVPAFAIWYYAILRVGAIAVSVSTRAAAAEVAFIAEDCEAKGLVAETGQLDVLTDFLPDCVKSRFGVSDIMGNDLATAGGGDSGSPVYDANPNDAALILYTSGTTGFPKGATLSHMNVRSNVCAFNHLCNMQAEDRILLAVPLFHCFGQNALLNSAFHVGATLVLQRRFDLNEAKQLITSQRVTQLYGVPMMFQLFADSCEPVDLDSVNYCFSAAAPLPIQISERWQEKFQLPINEGYGLTETSPFASYNHRTNYVLGSIGTPIDCVEMKIVDTESGQDCEVGRLGEIAVRGPNVMLGYWNRPNDTAAAIRDGWFYSGDIGRIDDCGFFYIVDRVKDMISVGGLKVFPAEVERILLDHSAVSEAAVVGVSDDVFGEQVVAFVVTPDDAAEGLLAKIQQHARKHLANYKVPRLVVRIDELPRNPSGKVLKTKLREYDFTAVSKAADTEDARPVLDTSAEPHGGSAKLADQAPDSAAEAAGEESLLQNQLRLPTLRRSIDGAYASHRREVVIQFVQHLVKEVSAGEQLPDEDARFLDEGLDSLMIVEMSNQIQVEVGPEVDIPATLLFDHPRVNDLSDFLLSILMPDEPTTQPSSKSSASAASEAPDQSIQSEVESMTEDEALEELLKELNS